LAGGLLDALVVLFAAVFLAVSPGEYKNGFLMLLPRSQRDGIDEALLASSRALRKWLLGTLVSMLVVAVLVGGALWALGVPSFVALGLIAGIAQFVPVVGPIVAAAPGILLALSVSPQTAMWTALAYFLASQLEANLIYPVIQKKAVSMSPALTLFAILALGALFGPLGIVLATPILVVAMIFIIKLYVNRTLGEDAPVPGQNNSK
jgi:predicted PurR-regulated permease PerM